MSSEVSPSPAVATGRESRRCALDGCSATFMPLRPNQRFCRGEHRKLAWERRWRPKRQKPAGTYRRGPSRQRRVEIYLEDGDRERLADVVDRLDADHPSDAVRRLIRLAYLLPGRVGRLVRELVP